MDGLLQLLYDGQIHWTISTHDAGFQWKLAGNGEIWIAEGNAGTMNEAVARLVIAAIDNYPQSDFAKAHG